MIVSSMGAPRRRAVPWLVALGALACACGAEAGPADPVPDPPGAPAAVRLAFRVQPDDGRLAAALPPIEVVVQGGDGNLVAGDDAAVTIRLAPNATGATLGGATTVNAIDGVATFADLTIDRSGEYALDATSPGLDPTVSERFAVVFGMRQLTLGGYHTCGLATSGLAYCWGDNNYGQLGADAGAVADAPVAVDAGVTFASLTAGGGHTCGLTPAGEAYCWGNNVSGQLGDENAPFARELPTPVLGGLVFLELAAAGSHTCGVATDGRAYCWGYNGDGQLGNPGAGNESDLPVPVSGGLTFITLAAGDSHTCGLTTDGAAYCWGSNYTGQLGDGNAGSDSDVPVSVQGGLRFVRLAAGGQHSCGLTDTGAVYCWGANDSGALGNGELGVNRDVPVPVQGGGAFAGLAEAGAENGHACALADAGAAWCWGENRDGQLGNGARGVDRDAPAPVSGTLAFVTLATGGSHTCGITTAGAAYCWGANFSGQLGTRGPEDDQPTPVAVGDPAG